jgi:hypothetical protein
MALVACILVSVSAAAQEPWDYLGALGSTNFSENVPVEFGFVDLANGNLHLEIPLADPAQRGALRYNARFVYDSRVWMPVLYGNSWYWTYTQGAPAGYSNPTGHYGWDVFYDFGDLTNELASPPHTGITSWAEIPMTCFLGTRKVFNHFEVSQGQVTRYFDLTISQGGCGGYPSSADGHATDGSGYHLYVMTSTSMSLWDWKLIAPDGTDVTAYRDANGNHYAGNNPSLPSTMDTLGRIPVSVSGTRQAGSQVHYDVLNSQGSTSRYTVTYGNIYVATNFQQLFISESAVRSWCPPPSLSPMERAINSSTIHTVSFPA